MARLPEPQTSIRTTGASLRFYQADCVALLKQFKPASVDVIVTSPPYNLGVRYRSYDDTIPREDYQDASNIAPWRHASNGLRCRGNTWFIPYETIQSRDKDRPHPATFPPRLPE